VVLLGEVGTPVAGNRRTAAGLRGVGPTSVASLLLKHGTLDGVLDAWGDPPEAEIARTFREVGRMRGEDDEAELDAST